MDEKTTGPLSRFTVLDLTRVRSGPTAVRQLADWGANVIKIEPPLAVDSSIGLGGERHAPDFQNTHRNKRGMSLNLKHAAGRELLLRIVQMADVVVENFRPRVMERLGVDYPVLKEVNPRIVLASLSGFGDMGPYAARPAFDQIVQGMAGLMSVTGLPDQGPVRAGIPVADLGTGLYAAIGILIALLEREASGKGQWIKTSLMQSMLSLMDLQAAGYVMQGEIPVSAGNHHPTGMPTGLFRTKDGHLCIAADSEKMWRQLCVVLGDADLADDPEFATSTKRSQNRQRLILELETLLAAKMTDEWLATLLAAEVPCGPVYNIAQTFADPGIAVLNMRQAIKHPILGDIEVLSTPLTMSRSQSAIGRPAPERGEHTVGVLKELGLSKAEIDELKTTGTI